MSDVEIEFKVCRNCKESKARVRHSRNASGRMRFVGEDGKLWNGLMCGACHCTTVKVKKYNKSHEY
jgi:hypothetical protein